MGQYAKYVPLTSIEKYDRLRKINDVFSDFVKITGARAVSCRKDVLLEIIERVEKRNVYFHIFHDIVMSEQNEAALYCFWILKLSPFFDGANPNSHINALFAAFLFLRMVGRVGRRKGRVITVDRKYVQNLFYAFWYRDISKEAIMLAAETLLTPESRSLP
jgi:hypothetical protein